MSWTLIKKEEYPGVFKGMLIMVMICFLIWYFHSKANKSEISSLPIQVACTHTIQDPFTPVFTEDKLDSKPIAPQEKSEEKSEEKTQERQKKDETERTYTRTPDKESDDDGSDWEDEIIVDPPEIFDGPEEGNDTSSGVFVPLTPGTTEVDTSTERDEDITSTVITTDDSQNSNNGSLKIRIKRKIQ